MLYIYIRNSRGIEQSGQRPLIATEKVVFGRAGKISLLLHWLHFCTRHLLLFGRMYEVFSM